MLLAINCGLILLYLPYKEMSKIRPCHLNKMAAKFCSVNQQLYYYLQQ